jgi:hypothetical protein
MQYTELGPITRAAADEAFASNDPARICTAMVAVALNDPDWEYVEATCLQLLTSPLLDVRRVACTCLGHTARIHLALHRDVVEPLLLGLLADPEIGGWAEDALDDILIFLGPRPGAAS